MHVYTGMPDYIDQCLGGKKMLIVTSVMLAFQVLGFYFLTLNCISLQWSYLSAIILLKYVKHGGKVEWISIIHYSDLYKENSPCIITVDY